jgi:glycosidase
MKTFAALVFSFLLTPVFIFETYAQNTTYWWNDAVFYEAFVRSYYDTDSDGIGDFNGLTAKLDYIQSLGVNAIWLMPVCPSPSYHGYDITDYKALNPQYGTQQDYVNFVTAVHNRGMKVIFDMVANHTSNQHPWFQQSSANDTFYRNFYRWSTTIPNGQSGKWFAEGNSHNNYFYAVFGSTLPDLNYRDSNVEDSIFSVVDFWLDSMHVDGFRCDAAPYIVEDGDTLENTPETIQFWKDFHTRYIADNANAMGVGEVWEDDNSIQEFTAGGGLDFCFEFNLQGAILNAVTSKNTQGLVNEMSYISSNLPFGQYGTFLSNHDENRSYDQLGDNVYNAKVAAAIYMTLPGVPFIYYGEEIGMAGSGEDQNKRTPMQWTGGSNAGFSTATPWEPINSNYNIYNVAAESADSFSLLNWYKQLIALRHANPILCRGTYYEAGASSNAIFTFVRSYQGQNALVVVNSSSGAFSNQSIGLLGTGITEGVKYVTELISDSSFIDTVISQNIGNINIPAYGVSVYLLTDTVINPAAIENTSANRMQLSLYPNPCDGHMTLEFNQSTAADVSITVANTLGQIIEELNVPNAPSQYQQVLDLGTQPAGLYFIYLRSWNGTAVGKVFITK